MYLSTSPGIGGILKQSPEDFIVEEVMPDGTILELDKTISREGTGRFTHFVLQKKNWSTSSAALEIAKKLHVGHKRIDFAGTKDKVALTVQLGSAYDVTPQEILGIQIKDIRINGAWPAPDKVRLGSLLGNRFTITVREAHDHERVAEIEKELGGKFPNYFGEQRFGSTRRNTHLIGQKILEEKFEDACMMFLCDILGEENAESRAARQELLDTKDFSAALRTFPKHLRLERKMLSVLSRNEDYIAALKYLPRTTLLLFVHAFQSHLFNEMLSERIKDGIELEQGEYFCGETMGFPDIKKADASGWICGKLIGYQSPINARETEILGKYAITKDHFRIPRIPEISSKGTYRTLLAPLKNFSFDKHFRFVLPSGSYATVAMAEFMKGG